MIAIQYISNLFVGFIKNFLTDYVNIFSVEFYLYFNISILLITIIYCIYLAIINFKLNFVLACSVITGSILYAPFLLDINPMQAGAIGIGMHYIQ